MATAKEDMEKMAIQILVLGAMIQKATRSFSDDKYDKINKDIEQLGFEFIRRTKLYDKLQRKKRAING
jgi:hypothetical protein